jgi:sugar lactone lactonase YvrE
VYVVDSGNNRVEKWSMSEPTYGAVFGSEGSGQGQFKGPTGVAVDSYGDRWVTDSANNRVEELSPTGTFVMTFGWGVNDGKPELETCTSNCKAGIAGSEPGQLKAPWGIAFAKGNIWVTDTGNSRVEEFSPEGKYVMKFGSSAAGAGQLEIPLGIAVAPNGNIWVAENNRNYVKEFKENGEFVTSFTILYQPTGIALASNGNIWVAEAYTDHVQEFSPSGEPRTQVGTEGSGNGQLRNPQGVSIDEKGNLWVVDIGNNRVEEFSPAGEYITQFGSPGSGTGQFSGPTGIAVAGGSASVVDTGNNRVQQWTVWE